MSQISFQNIPHKNVRLNSVVQAYHWSNLCQLSTTWLPLTHVTKVQVSILQDWFISCIEPNKRCNLMS